MVDALRKPPAVMLAGGCFFVKAPPVFAGGGPLCGREVRVSSTLPVEKIKAQAAGSCAYTSSKSMPAERSLRWTASGASRPVMILSTAVSGAYLMKAFDSNFWWSHNR